MFWACAYSIYPQLVELVDDEQLHGQLALAPQRRCRCHRNGHARNARRISGTQFFSPSFGCVSVPGLFARKANAGSASTAAMIWEERKQSEEDERRGSGQGMPWSRTTYASDDTEEGVEPIEAQRAVADMLRQLGMQEPQSKRHIRRCGTDQWHRPGVGVVGW